MADIVPNESKINDVEIKFQANLSEILFARFGANINSLLDSGKVEIFGVGSHTWTKPANLKRPVMVILTGAGGRVRINIPTGNLHNLFRFSGGAGAGGTAIKTFAASDLGATEAVEIVASAETGVCSFGSFLSVPMPTQVLVTSNGVSPSVDGEFNWMPGEGSTPTGGDLNIKGGSGSNPTVNVNGYWVGGTGGGSFWGNGQRGGHVTTSESFSSGFRFRTGGDGGIPGAGSGGFSFKRNTNAVGISSSSTGGPGLCMVIIL